MRKTTVLNSLSETYNNHFSMNDVKVNIPEVKVFFYVEYF